MTNEDINKLKAFEEVMERALHSLEALEEFSLNRLPGNIAISQEFAHVSPLRQRVCSLRGSNNINRFLENKIFSVCCVGFYLLDSLLQRNSS